MIRHLAEAARNPEQRSQDIGKIATQSASLSADQQEKTDMVAAAVNQMGSTVLEIAQNANQAAQAATLAKNDSAKGQEVLNKTINNIQQMANPLKKSRK